MLAARASLTAAAGVKAVARVALRGSLAGRRAALSQESLFSSFRGNRLAPLAAASATGRAAASARRSLAGRAFATVAAPEQETMVAQLHKEYFRKDYKPPAYLVDSIHLNFVLNEDVTRVESRMRVLPNHAAGERPALFLNGREDVKLVSVKINGETVPVEGYEVEAAGLTIKAPPAGEFDLEIATDLHPEQNTSLEGLYKSGGNFCTQCEAEGFRGITFFQDRPDVMAKYTTRIEADKARYPVLLSNGNLIQSGELEGGRHFTVWEDPFRKPCYLFALVAGNLAMKEETFTTISGKTVALRIFVNEHNIGRVDFAMESLKRSMKWDEDVFGLEYKAHLSDLLKTILTVSILCLICCRWDEDVFGLEYDLDLFNIVAVDDFNMGAMENKSLNIFNSRLVLATPDTATDGDFARIEGVVGHEYFHNFTGNRVTCRDWFQLTLKEGLTVYRDQEFSADMNSRPVKRIEDVIRLRAAQFSEDNGPMAHPIRPESYIKMDNFYTLTVYEKGAEVVRLYEAVLGKAGFRKGMDLYFQRHDGQAVTCDDFLAAMADANSEDLSSLAKTSPPWLGGTARRARPVVTAVTSYNPSDKTFTLKLSQTIQPTPGQPTKDPVLIPAGAGVCLLTCLPCFRSISFRSGPELGTETVLRLTDKEQEFVFENVEARPVPSLLRGFSAPVHLTVEGQTDEDLLHLLAFDTDSFNRWEAGHVLAKKLMRELYHAAAQSSEGSVAERLAAAGGVKPSLVDAYRALLTDKTVDGAFKAYAVSLPEQSELVDKIPEADPVLLYEVREYVTRELAQRLRPELEAAVAANDDAPGTPYEFTAAACARRALKNKALGYLAALGEPAVTEQLARRAQEATNMTDEISALVALDRAGGQLGASPGCVAARKAALEGFFDKWQSEPLVLLKWFTLQAGSNAQGNLAAVKALVEHPSFHITNPNSCYSLFLGFARSPVNFHAADGSGYEFLGDMVLKVDKINRQVASRLVSAFSTFKNYDPARQALMKAQLQRIVDTEGLSDNVFEIAVLLEGFGWQSWQGNAWWRTLRAQVPELAKLGLYNLSSRYGSEEELRGLCADLLRAGIRPMADIVINHRCADDQDESGKWTVYRDKVPHPGSSIAWGRWAITCNDPSFCGQGAPDSGEDYGPAPDLDHTNPVVRDGIVDWLNWLHSHVGFEGWRFDFVKGYHPRFTAEYIERTLGPEAFCVGENFVDLRWQGSYLEHNQDDARSRFKSWLREARHCRLFDFITKGILQEAVKHTEYSRLRDSSGRAPGLVGWFPEMSVTFVDNHDTGSTQQHWPFPRGHLGLGYAYILTHPGIPCLLHEHLSDGQLRQTIADLIAVRQRAGIQADSKLEILAAEKDMYVARINGNVTLKLGPRYDMGNLVPRKEDGWALAAAGNDFAVWEKR
ncbi:hypothetical protein COHA_002401 [Chlorella ohadii]|uniref:alpha-amylase n=1 Tax=Chlorella ohadii TaxID=2649997 RepID=A0AAD5DTQ7_9CHLO|nr:hypothetical protein COHA_002401 [Chlorella ohadii]